MVRTLVRWDPWTDLETLRHEMDRVFDESLVRRYGRGEHHIHQHPAWKPLPLGMGRKSGSGDSPQV